jgi:hypothetical protein
MKRFNCALAAAVAAVAFTAASLKGEAGVSINIGANIGAAPVCPYGYYDYAPYACAPYGYYGPEWFTGGVFIGAGPWFHGPAGFHGHVDNRFDVHHGYGGPLPNRGDHPEPSRRPDRIDHFRGNETRDGHGHVSEGRR